MATAKIFGSGFGLYGHGVTLAKLDYDLILPDRYFPLCKRRADLSRIMPTMSFFNESDFINETTDLVILAQRPRDVWRTIEAQAQLNSNATFIVEKPLASTPSAGIEMANHIDKLNVSWTTPYMLLHTDWFKRLAQEDAADRFIELTWNQQISKRNKPWKSEIKESGGIEGYYFVHIFALVDKLFPTGIDCLDYHSEDSRLSLVGRNIKSHQTVQATFQTSDTNSFSVTVNERVHFKGNTPFENVSCVDFFDERVPTLTNFYRSAPEHKPKAFSIGEGAKAYQIWSRCLTRLNVSRRQSKITN